MTSGSLRLAKAMPRQPHTSIWLSATALIPERDLAEVRRRRGGATSTVSSLRSSISCNARMVAGGNPSGERLGSLRRVPALRQGRCSGRRSPEGVRQHGRNVRLNVSCSARRRESIAGSGIVVVDGRRECTISAWSSARRRPRRRRPPSACGRSSTCSTRPGSCGLRSPKTVDMEPYSILSFSGVEVPWALI